MAAFSHVTSNQICIMFLALVMQHREKYFYVRTVHLVSSFFYFNQKSTIFYFNKSYIIIIPTCFDTYVSSSGISEVILR